MKFTSPIPFADAIKARQRRALAPTALGSAQIQRIAPEIRERAMFSARVNHAGFLASIDQQISDLIESPEITLDPNTARANIKKQLKAIGYDPDNPPEGFEPAKAGSLEDISSDARLNLIIDTNLQMAHGYGQFAAANDPDILDDFPCWELVRQSQRKERREWREKWVQAGGKLYGSARMIARKDDPIWTKLGPFQLPYPPFDYNSGMGVEEVDREEAEDLGVITSSTIVEPQTRQFNDGLNAAAPNTSSSRLRAIFQGLFSTALDGRISP